MARARIVGFALLRPAKCACVDAKLNSTLTPNVEKRQYADARATDSLFACAAAREQVDPFRITDKMRSMAHARMTTRSIVPRAQLPLFSRRFPAAARQFRVCANFGPAPVIQGIRRIAPHSRAFQPRPRTFKSSE
ncbi:hypothetical protein [Burkholderia latens]|uniref:hypothetical protein n=1 Tax=Burkholderia latens TaxID=488446 RepID=UPI00158263D4|nr:hypothetical protein [Burkholderia latens]